MASPGGVADADGAHKAAALQPSSSSSSTTKLPSLTIRALQDITNDFSEERALGQGAYGKVYKGVYKNGEEIAVKLLHNTMPGMDDGLFEQEFENLMRLQHHNVVRLVGYCYESKYHPFQYNGKTVFAEKIYRALCFDYMKNGSLQRHLSDECRGLDWPTRYKIIKGTCEGLKYLHKGFEEPIYHLDLKPDNILLDENMTPKLADFGLSRRLFGEGQTMVTQSPLGTIGYMPPEYLFQQTISNKLDIYSLGVIMTKIIAGPAGHTKSAEMPFQEFLDLVHENWSNRFEQTSTSSWQLEAYCQQVNICTEIAMSCLETDRHKRPSIVDIIHRLNGTETVVDKADNCEIEDDTISLELEALPRSKAIPGEQPYDKFPVLVRVMVPPWRLAKEMPRSGIDFVAVVQKGWPWVVMAAVINKLGPNDRLSIVAFGRDVQRLQLTYMSDQAKDAAWLQLNEIENEEEFGDAPAGVMSHAVQEGDMILRQRGVRDSRTRSGCILLMFETHDDSFSTKEVHTGLFPFYVCVIKYGRGWNMYYPSLYKYIGSKTSGAYSWTNDSLDYVRITVAGLIAGLTSLVATSIKIILGSHDGVSISSIESGGYNNLVSSDKKSGVIDIDDIYAGERKGFIVYLKVLQGKDRLMTVGGQYQSSLNASKQLAARDVVVLRTCQNCSPDMIAIHPEVAAELARIQLRKGILPLRKQYLISSRLEELWNMIKGSDDSRGATNESLSGLDKVIDEMKRYKDKDSERMYMNSWLTCHKWQHFVGLDEDGGTELVKVQMFASSKAIPDRDESTELTVIVRVKAASWCHAHEMPRIGVDVVAVLDVRGEETLERVKQAMMIVIHKLDVNDRLSILTFGTYNYEHIVMELTYMSEHGRDVARLKINELVKGNGSDVASALREGAQILMLCGAEEGSGRVGCMMFLSDGEYPEIFHIKINPQFPVHTFGLGADHNPRLMKNIADETSGTYSYVNQEVGMIKEALTLFITGLTSVIATSINITLRNLGSGLDANISLIESGGYSNHIESDEQSGTVVINNIYTGETKDFIFHLIIHDHKKLMHIGGHYRSFNGVKRIAKQNVHIPEPDNLTIHHEMAAELTRIRLANGLSDMLEKQDLTAEGLQQLWDGVKDSDEGRQGPEVSLLELAKDVAAMQRDIEKPERHISSGLPYMLSWLSCHRWQRATTKGTPESSTAFRTIGQHADDGTNLVKVDTFTRSNAIPSRDTCSEFPVLVRVTGQNKEDTPRGAVDIVAVLDVSDAEEMCMLMHAIMDKLCPNDRLSIVCQHRLMQLTYMSDRGKDDARYMCRMLPGSQNDIGAALEEAAKILCWRGAAESSKRVGCIVFMSHGEYLENFDQTQISTEFPVHTFGLGAKHSPELMKNIADKTSGTYSFVNKDINMIKGALELLIPRLTWVVAKSIKITLRSEKGVTISSIESGGYLHHIKSNKRSATIDINSINAGERKDFIINLTIQPGTKQLMSIGSRYLSHDTIKHLVSTEVSVMRPQLDFVPSELAIHRDVAAELVRIQLVDGVTAMLEMHGGINANRLQQLWERIMHSEEGRSAREETMSSLGADVLEMNRDIEIPEKYIESGLPYTLSWLTSHKWQRATIKGKLSSSGDFQAIGQDAEERPTRLVGQ